MASIRSPVIRLRWRGQQIWARSRYRSFPPARKRWILRARTLREMRRRLSPYVKDGRWQKSCAAWGRWWTPTCAHRNLNQLLRKPAGAAGTRRRLLVVTARKHVGLNTCAGGGVLTVAVCHSRFRRSVRVGDILICVSTLNGVIQTPLLPPAFSRAVCSLPRGSRAVLALARITRVIPVAKYHGPRANGRLDNWYRPARANDRAPIRGDSGEWFRPRFRARFGPGPRPTVATHKRNLKFPVASSRCFWRSDGALTRAPIWSRRLSQKLFQGAKSVWKGRGVKILQGAARSAALTFLRRIVESPP